MFKNIFIFLTTFVAGFLAIVKFNIFGNGFFSFIVSAFWIFNLYSMAKKSF